MTAIIITEATFGYILCNNYPEGWIIHHDVSDTSLETITSTGRPSTREEHYTKYSYTIMATVLRLLLDANNSNN